MAPIDATPLSYYGVAHRVYFRLDDPGVPTATISKDGGAFVATSASPVEIAVASRHYYLDLTTTEMAASATVIAISIAAIGVVTSLYLYQSASTAIRGAGLPWGVAYRAYFRVDNAGTPTTTVSLDGAPFVATTSTAVEIGPGSRHYYVDLTAEQMAANVVILSVAINGLLETTQYLYQAAALATSASSLRLVTSSDLVSRALKLIGVQAAGETLRAEDAADGLERLNEILDGWATQRLTQSSLRRTVTTLTASQTSYSIGPGGDINIPRPTTIDAAGLIWDTSATTPIESPIPVLSDQQWPAVRQKTLTHTHPSVIYYDHAWSSGLGRVYVYAVPTSATTQLVLYSPAVLPFFASLTESFSFAPGVVRALRYALARELAPEYGRPWGTDLEDRAREALADLKRTNTRHAVLASPFIGGGHYYDIYTDS